MWSAARRLIGSSLLSLAALAVTAGAQIGEADGPRLVAGKLLRLSLLPGETVSVALDAVAGSGLRVGARGPAGVTLSVAGPAGEALTDAETARPAVLAATATASGRHALSVLDGGLGGVVTLRLAVRAQPFVALPDGATTVVHFVAPMGGALVIAAPAGVAPAQHPALVQVIGPSGEVVPATTRSLDGGRVLVLRLDAQADAGLYRAVIGASQPLTLPPPLFIRPGTRFQRAALLR